MCPCRRPSLLVALLAASAAAQIDASYAPYGTGCAGTGIGLGATDILPAAAATRFGSGNVIPFGWSSNKYQQVFLGSELPSPRTLAALALRFTNQPGITPTFVVDMEISVGYSTRWQGTLDTTFANNWDVAPPVNVLPRSQVTLPDVQQATSPTDFGVLIPWNNTFAWAPAAGQNLMVEITVYGNSVGGGVYGYPLDNVSGCYSVWGTPATATSGQIRTFGPVMGLVEQTNTAVPRLYSTSTPQIGNTFRVRVAQCRPSTPALMLLGASSSRFNGLPLPFDLGILGAPGCPLLASAEVMQTMTINSSGAGSIQYSLPNTIYLLSQRFYNQALVVDPAANVLGLAVSNGGVGLVGNQ
ncbi:MAG: hypothetical protein R3F56_16670 [Planctomycetota bacterium]